VTLSPDAQRSIEEANARQRARWNGEKPLVDPRMGARSIGDIARLTVGCEVWSVNRVDANEEALGGVVLEVTDKIEDDELIRSFRVINPFLHVRDPRAYSVITVTEANREGLCVADTGTLGRLIRRLATAAGNEGGVIVTSRMAQDIRNAHLLTSAVMAGL
jgi:hypothetical protein